jgi:hypothetical protein
VSRSATETVSADARDLQHRTCTGCEVSPFEEVRLALTSYTGRCPFEYSSMPVRSPRLDFIKSSRIVEVCHRARYACQYSSARPTM